MTKAKKAPRGDGLALSKSLYGNLEQPIPAQEPQKSSTAKDQDSSNKVASDPAKNRNW